MLVAEVDDVVKLEVSLAAPVVCSVVAGAHSSPFQLNTCPLVAPVVVPKGDPLIFETVVSPRLPVTSPLVAAVNGLLATPFTVLINWLLSF